MQRQFEVLTPNALVRRSAEVFAERTAVVDGDLRLSYAELGDRVRQLAGGLGQLGVSAGDRVAVLAPNTHVMLEATLGVPLVGAVLVALNTRLAAPELGYILDHSGAGVLVYDQELAEVVAALPQQVRAGLRMVRAGGATDEYEAMVRAAPLAETPVAADDQLLALNYTSGTTGRPKGAMYHHRGAYLQALSMAYHARLAPGSVYLWTLPMFHCNGWCFPWAVTAAGAAHVCLRRVEPAAVWDRLRREGVTHCCAAPTVLSAMVHAPAASEGPLATPLRVATGGAPPAPALLARAAELRIDVQHLYGLTETFGPSVVCEWWPEWDDLPLEEQARRKARQGVGTVVTGGVLVARPGGDEVVAVAPDGEELGELLVRGDNTMLGYYRDPDASAGVWREGWLRTGDLAVVHPDGYVEIRDRAKDVIISGGENISSVEVEQALSSHPAVLECAVVGWADEHWGETPVAFVTVHEQAEVTAEALKEHVRARLARFKAPKRIAFVDELPKTATGKIQKFRLREEGARR